MNDGWLQVHLPARADEVARIETALESAGALSVTLADAEDQPLLEPAPGEIPLWDEVTITGLFPADVEPDALRLRLQGLLGTEALPGLRIEPLAERDWVRAWMEGYRPMRFGERLWVVPEGFEPPEPSAVNLRLDPGLAFGTGTHPTTRLCLEWLEGEPLEGVDLVDYGCGSGILAIAALLLGARSVLAVDLDPQALEATRTNARRNGIADRLVTALPGREPPFRPHRLVANILASPLRELAPKLATWPHAEGAIALSGILDSQWREVAAAYAPWRALSPTGQIDEWVLLTGQT